MSSKNNKPHWIKFFSRGQHPVLINDIAWQSLIIQPETTDLPKLNFYKRDIKSTYFDRDEHHNLLSVLKLQLKNQPQKVLNQLKKAEEQARSLICLAKRYNGYDWSSASNERVKSRLFFFLHRFVPLFCFLYYPLWLEEIGTELLRELLREIKPKEREKIIWQITRSIKLTSREKFNLALLHLACQLQQSKKFNKKIYQKKINNLVSDYSYLPSYLLQVRFYTPKEIEKEIKRLLAKNPCQEKKEKIELLKQQQKEGQIILQGFGPQVRKIAKVLSADVWLRDERIAWYGKIFSLVHPLFCEAAKRIGLTYQEFVQQRISEIQLAKFSKTELQARAEGYTYIVKNGLVNISSFQKKLTSSSKKKIIKGQIANPGKVRGRVRTGTAYTFHQLKSGEIAVSGMTTPEATLFLRKAAAIITDEGGITCHAAIISRELGIPCIIGTKIATQVLKDGDRVEVDASKGIVKKLK